MKQKIYKNNKELVINFKRGRGVLAGKTRDVQKQYGTSLAFNFKFFLGGDGEVDWKQRNK